MRWGCVVLWLSLAGCATGEAQVDEPASVSAVAPEAPVAAPRPPTPQAAPPASPAWSAEVTVVNAPFSTPGSPSAVVHAPPGFDPSAPLHVVVFVHGWRGCARQLAYGGDDVRCRDGARPVTGWDLAARFDEARVNALFVVPQLAFLVQDGSAGAFVHQGRFAAYLEELLGALRDRLGPPSDLSRVASITLLAHSAGYETALAILGSGGVGPQLRAVVLLDALYRGHNRFADWVLEDPAHRLVSLHGATGRTVSQSELLVGRLRRPLGPALSVAEEGALEALVRDHRVVVARASAPHGDIPARHTAEVLRGLLGTGATE